MASSGRKMEDTLTCAICTEVFRNPVTLPCQHSYCRECLQAFAESSCKQICPVCRRPTDLGTQGVAGLPTSFVLAEIVENFQTGRHPKACGNTPLCEQHVQALSIYCVTCKDLMCVGCIDQHSDHISISIQKAFETEKLTFIKKMKACGKSEEKMVECLQELLKIIDSIKEQERRRRCQVQEEYKTALKALDSWRENALQTLQKEHKKWLDECNAMTEDFRMKLQETENLLIRSKALSSGTGVGFLQEYKTVSARMSDNFQFTKTLVDKQEDLVLWCNKFLADESDPLIYLRLIAKCIQKPMLKFAKGGTNETKITEAGAQVEKKATTSNKAVWTNGNIQSGQHYWEYEVIINLKKDPVFYCMCHVHVAVAHTKQPYEGGKTCWGMGLESKGHTFVCGKLTGCDDVVPKYQEWTPNPGRHNLGVYLDCENRTMTVIECSQNQVMWTQGNIDVSKPLFPLVAFGCPDGNQPAVSASARLVLRDNKTLLPMLSETINGQAH